MTTYNRICIKDYAITDSEGSTAVVKRGKEYLTSAVTAEGTVTVLSKYWFLCPVEMFAGEQLFTP